MDTLPGKDNWNTWCDSISKTEEFKKLRRKYRNTLKKQKS